MKPMSAKRKPRAMQSKAWKRAAQMPSLYHQLPGQEFDIMKSEVVDWLHQQPEIREATYNWYRSRGAIVFRDGRWHGAENDSLTIRE
jgi:hypothetical protein